MFSIATIPWSSTLSPSSVLTHLAKGCIFAPSPVIHVIGQVFDAFARFPLTDATSQDKSVLRHDVGIAGVELLVLAAGAIALESVTSALRIATPEQNVVGLHKKLYEAVMTREMEWFDTKMVAEDSVITVEGNGPVGAGGLMAEFANSLLDPSSQRNESKRRPSNIG